MHFLLQCISWPAWWGICRFLHTIKTNPHLYPGIGGLGVCFDWCMHKVKDKEVKRNVHRDKRVFVEELANEAETAAAEGDLNTVYYIIKQLSGQITFCNKPVRDKQEKLLTTEREQVARWVQHFEEVFNRPEPNKPVDPDPSDDIDINISLPSQAEVETAIKAMKSGKALGID